MEHFIPIFLLLILFQSLFAIVQVLRYQKEIKAIKGPERILGVGARKNGIGAGSLFIVALNKQTLTIEECRKMKGITVFSLFKEQPEYIGMTLEELRNLGLEEDARMNEKYRVKHPYDPETADKRKGAIIQAVEVIERQLRRLNARESG